MIGQRLVEQLLECNYKVRVLSRSSFTSTDKIEKYTGSILNSTVLDSFVRGADLLFHCAAELHNEKEMEEVNVEGTRNICDVVRNSGIAYFCFISSAGVIGRNDEKWATEASSCQPQNEYERTKYIAETIAAKKIEGCSTVILRPLNVVDTHNPGIIHAAMRGGLKDKIRFIIKGAECAHLVHAKKIASCALYFASRNYQDPEIFFVGDDELDENTFKSVWNVCRQITNTGGNCINWTLPAWLPHWVRIARNRRSNIGSIRYSSQKLRDAGFKEQWSIEKIVLESAIEYLQS